MRRFYAQAFFEVLMWGVLTVVRRFCLMKPAPANKGLADLVLKHVHQLNEQFFQSPRHEWPYRIGGDTHWLT